MATKSSKPKAKAAASVSKSSGGLGAKLRNPKNRLWVIVAAFVLIGGAVMVYKSFAAVPGDPGYTSVLYSANNGRLTANGTKVQDAAKNGNIVWSLAPLQTATTISSLPITKGQVCYMLRAGTPSRAYIGFTGTGYTASLSVSSQWGEQCINYPYTGTGHQAKIQAYANNYIQVSYISNKWQTSTSTPGPVK